MSLLLDVPLADVVVQVEEIFVKNCCGEICKRLPRYRKIDDIIIKNKQSFKVSHNQYYIQLDTIQYQFRLRSSLEPTKEISKYS
jgi:hypothetical protein